MPAVEEAVDTDLSGDLALIVETAREAGQIAMRFFRNSPEVWMKGGTSPVSEADYAVDSFLRDVLMAARPDYGWLSEETTDGEERLAARRLFVVDPIDGTRGFLAGRRAGASRLPWSKPAGRSPARSNVRRARRRSRRPRAAARSRTGRCCRSAPRPVDPRIGGPKNMIDALPPRILRTVESVPYVPSLAYRLAMIADGALDATFVKPNSHDWDLAAADLILSEAGGRLLDARGRRRAMAAPRSGMARSPPAAAICWEVLAGVISGRSG